MVTFETLEALESHYTNALSDASDDAAKLQLRAERGDALAAFTEGQQRAAQQREWRAQVLQQFPHARSEEIAGDTLESMTAAAKASHDHVQTILEQQEATRKQQQEEAERRGQLRYGSGNASGGGDGTPVSTPDPLKETTGKMQTELRKVTGIGARGQFNLHEVYQDAEDQVFSAIGARQSDAYFKRTGSLALGKSTKGENA